MVHGYRYIHLIELNSDRCQRLNHLGLIRSKSSSCVLQVNQTFLDNLIYLIPSDIAQILGSWYIKNFSILSVYWWLIFAQTYESTCFCVYTFDGLTAFTDDQSDQSCRHLDFHSVWTCCGTACHLSLGLYNSIQLLSDPFDGLGVSLYENISGFAAWGTASSNLYFLGARSLSNGLDSLPLLTDN